MSTGLPCFKAYDIRGKVPDELNPELARRIGLAWAEVVRPQGPVVIGRDNRLTSPEIADALAIGLNAGGVDTLDIGQCGTEVVYHAAARDGMGGGVMVTASHNPVDYNGMKMVRTGAIPISGDSGLRDIEALVTSNEPPPASRRGQHDRLDVMPGYVEHILSLVNTAALKPLKLVVNAGNGAAGPVLDALAQHLPFDFVRRHHEPDGHFPNGIPNPLLPENREVTAAAVRDSGADMGIAWDGDFDRCFFFDEQGRFIEGYYIVGLLAERMLEKSPGERIIHDPRLTWNTIDRVRHAGGTPVMCKTGHAFIKERMRAENALYGGEMSAHHYFRDFAYCDSGMLPWLIVAEHLSLTGRSLSSLVDACMTAFPCSGEINFRVNDPLAVMQAALEQWGDSAHAIDRTDGISLAFDDWRFNLRASNTEPMLRLNVETRADPALLDTRTDELRHFITRNG